MSIECSYVCLVLCVVFGVSTGAAATLAVFGAAYLAIVLAASVSVRTPPAGYLPAGYKVGLCLRADARLFAWYWKARRVSGLPMQSLSVVSCFIRVTFSCGLMQLPFCWFCFVLASCCDSCCLG